MPTQSLNYLKRRNRDFTNVLDSMVTKEDLDFKQNSYMGLSSTSAGPGIYSLPECLMLGLNPTWRLNFGGATLAAGSNSTDLHMLDVLTPVNTLFKMSLALARVASGDAVTAAESSQIFGATGVAGAKIALGSATTATDIIPATLTVNTLTGTLASTLVLDDTSTDLASDNDQALVVFGDNAIMAASTVLTIGLHANNEHKASANEFVVSGAGTNVMTRQAVTTDAHQNIVLTASAAATTILPGSFIYLQAGADTDEMSIKGCIRTTGGTVAITYAN